MTQKINHENIGVMFLFGLKFLFDGYLMNYVNKHAKMLITLGFLFDGYLIKG